MNIYFNGFSENTVLNKMQIYGQWLYQNNMPLNISLQYAFRFVDQLNNDI